MFCNFVSLDQLKDFVEQHYDIASTIDLKSFINNCLFFSCSGRQRVQQGVRLHPIQQRDGAADRADQHDGGIWPGWQATQGEDPL